MRVVLLGTKGGPAVRQKGSWPTSSFVEIGGHGAVVDCGAGVTRGLVEAGVSLRDLPDIYLTHLHSDHCLELGPLLHTAWTTGLGRPLNVHGPAGTAALVAHFWQAMAFDIDIRIADEGRPDIRSLVRVHEYGEGPVSAGDGLAVTALRVIHPPVREAYALRFEAGGQAVVFSGDTAFCPAIAGFAAGAAILVHEAMLAEGVEKIIARTPNASDRLRTHLYASHTLAADAGRVARMAGVGHLVLNHLVPADDPDIGEAEWLAAVRETWDGPLTVGRDGLEVVPGAIPRRPGTKA
ncbi:MAG: MBL fold metallo-hydrolase [Rhizobiaceae bacterium]